MKTEDFISLLATGAKPVDPHLDRKRFTQAIAMGGITALVLMLITFGIRPDIKLMLDTPLFWLKIAFPVALTAGSLLVLLRLCRPGTRIGKRWSAPVIPVAIIWIAGLVCLQLAPEAERISLIMGVTWRTCPFNIAFLSIPTSISIIWAVRQLAPTELRLTGAVAGLLAGSLATIAYSLHCPEMGVPFWGVWYVVGIFIPAALGALLGPKLLQW